MEKGWYYCLPCPKCGQSFVIGLITLGGLSISARCDRCSFEGSYVAYGNMAVTLYLRSGMPTDDLLLSKGILKS